MPHGTASGEDRGAGAPREGRMRHGVTPAGARVGGLRRDAEDHVGAPSPSRREAAAIGGETASAGRAG